MQRRIAAALGLLTLVALGPLDAAERKAPDEVSTDDLTSQSQKVVSDANKFDLVWWIPLEFWESVFAQDPSVDAATADEIVNSLRGYSMLAVVQANVSPLGAFSFLNAKQVVGGLSVAYAPSSGDARPLEPLRDLDGNLELMLNVLRPVLAQALGNMGENMHFFVLPDEDASGGRFASPYDFGTVEISLGARKSSPPVRATIELPLDALFVPRACPNGKAAHVTWTHCPWGGSRLED